MVVEDEPDLYDTLLAMFDIWSVDGVAFTNGLDAIRWIDDVDADPNGISLPELAVLDIRLPGASGPEIGHRLRKSPLLRNIAIVLMTAYRLTPHQEREVIAMAQADALLYKPLPAPKEFHARLTNAVRNRQSGV
jgi:CheY-like chemotaxis protein